MLSLAIAIILNHMFDREHYSQSGLYGVYGATRNIMTSFKYNFCCALEEARASYGRAT